MSGGVTWVSFLALVLSAVSLAWQTTLTVVRWPRLAVQLEHQVGVKRLDDDEGSLFHHAEFTVFVQNAGREPLVIWDVGLRTPNGFSVSARNLRRSQERTRESHLRGTGRPILVEDEVAGPDLPCEIQAQAVLQWTFLNAATSSVGRDTVLRGYASRFRAGRRPSTRLSRNELSRWSSRLEPLREQTEWHQRRHPTEED